MKSKMKQNKKKTHQSPENQKAQLIDAESRLVVSKGWRWDWV